MVHHFCLDNLRRPYSAVEFGIVLAALMFVRKVTKTTTVSHVTKKEVEEGRLHILQDKPIPDYVSIVRIHGPFLFGATDKLFQVLDNIDEVTPVVILKLRHMTALDATGMLALEDFADRLHSAGRVLILCGARPQPAKLMGRAEFERHIGPENICPHIQAALQRAEYLYQTRKEAALARSA
jgi:sulfate permease, SulP family